MIYVTYTSDPDTITLTGDVSASFTAATLVASEGTASGSVNLDDGVTNIDIDPNQTILEYGSTESRSNTIKHFNWLAEGGIRATLNITTDISFSGQLVTITGVSGTTSTSGMTVRASDNGIANDSGQFDVLSDGVVVIKGIEVPRTTINGYKSPQTLARVLSNLNNAITIANDPQLSDPDATVIRYSVTSTTGSRDILPTESLILVNISAAATLTLPDASEVASGRVIQIKDVGGNLSSYTLTIGTNGGNIDGNASIEITKDYASYGFLSNGTNYFIL